MAPSEWIGPKKGWVPRFGASSYSERARALHVTPATSLHCDRNQPQFCRTRPSFVELGPGSGSHHPNVAEARPKLGERAELGPQVVGMRLLGTYLHDFKRGQHTLRAVSPRVLLRQSSPEGRARGERPNVCSFTPHFSAHANASTWMCAQTQEIDADAQRHGQRWLHVHGVSGARSSFTAWPAIRVCVATRCVGATPCGGAVCSGRAAEPALIAASPDAVGTVGSRHCLEG